MNMLIRNILTLCMKEILVILKDPRNRVVLFMPILVQSMIFGYVATFDLNRVPYALLDESNGPMSQKLAEEFAASPIFELKAVLGNTKEIARVLDHRKSLMVIHIGPDFDRKFQSGTAAPVQVAVDGRNGNIAAIASGYASAILNRFNAKHAPQTAEGSRPPQVTARAWYNPNLESRWNFLSGMVAVLAMVQVMVLTSLSVSREREQGTFDQLLVTPFSSAVILIGKALPPVCIGLFQSCLVLLIALFWFRIEFAGSLLLLALALVLFNMAIVGIGLCISTLTSTMQQSMLYSFSLLITLLLLSGFITPVSSMPDILQGITLANPVRYGVELAQRIYLEGAGFVDVYRELVALAVIAGITLTAASRLFRLQH